MAYMIVRKTQNPPRRHGDTETAKDEVAVSAINGEEGTGYEGPEGGLFACGNCLFFDEETVSCGQKDMMAKSKRPKIESGRVVVHPDGCCEYVSRKSTTEGTEDAEGKKN